MYFCICRNKSFRQRCKSNFGLHSIKILDYYLVCFYSNLRFCKTLKNSSNYTYCTYTNVILQALLLILLHEPFLVFQHEPDDTSPEAESLGWLIACVPVCCVQVFALYQIIENRRRHRVRCMMITKNNYLMTFQTGNFKIPLRLSTCLTLNMRISMYSNPKTYSIKDN